MVFKGQDFHEIKDFPLESLLDMPLRLGKLKHIVFGDKVDLFEFDTVFTLFELIDAISMGAQLSWYTLGL